MEAGREMLPLVSKIAIGAGSTGIIASRDAIPDLLFMAGHRLHGNEAVGMLRGVVYSWDVLASNASCVRLPSCLVCSRIHRADVFLKLWTTEEAMVTGSFSGGELISRAILATADIYTLAGGDLDWSKGPLAMLRHGARSAVVRRRDATCIALLQRVKFSRISRSGKGGEHLKK